MSCMKYLSLRTSRDISGPQDAKYLRRVSFCHFSSDVPSTQKNQHSCSKWVPTLVTCLVSMSILHHVSDSVGTSASRTLNSSKFKDATGTCFVCSIFWLEPTTMYAVWLRISGVTSTGWMWIVRLYEINGCLKDKWHQKGIYFLNKRIFSSLLEVTLSIRALTRLQWQASNVYFHIEHIYSC